MSKYTLNIWEVGHIDTRYIKAPRRTAGACCRRRPHLAPRRPARSGLTRRGAARRKVDIIVGTGPWKERGVIERIA